MSTEDIVARENFLFTLEWLLAVTKRYPSQLQFALAHIDFQDPKILGETFGAQMASQKLDDVLHSLRKAFRKTDLVARIGVDFWILVPYTPANENLVEKIKYIVDTASQSGLQIVERDISIFSLPIEVTGPIQDNSTLEFLSYLKKNHTPLAQHSASLRPVN